MGICKGNCSEDPNGDCYVCGNPTPYLNQNIPMGEDSNSGTIINKDINSTNWWEIDKIVVEPSGIGIGTAGVEFVYLIDRYTGQVKKVKVN
jgi:hypothetical protein